MDGPRSIGAGILALLIGGLFVFIFVPLIQTTLAATEKPSLSPIELGLATGVAGYVGGVIAMWYGVGQNGGLTSFGGRLLPPASDIVKAVIGLSYVIVYAGITAYAAFAWREKGDLTPEALISEITVAIGIAFAVVTKLVSK